MYAENFYEYYKKDKKEADKILNRFLMITVGDQLNIGY